MDITSTSEQRSHGIKASDSFCWTGEEEDGEIWHKKALSKRTGGGSWGTGGTGGSIGNTLSRSGSGGSGGRRDPDVTAAEDSIGGEEGKLRDGEGEVDGAVERLVIRTKRSCN